MAVFLALGVSSISTSIDVGYNACDRGVLPLALGLSLSARLPPLQSCITPERSMTPEGMVPRWSGLYCHTLIVATCPLALIEMIAHLVLMHVNQSHRLLQ